MSRSNIIRLIAIAAWLAIIGIAYATLTKVGFVYAIYFKLAPYLMHPKMQTYAHLVHMLAFGLLGALFMVAYPKRLLLVCCIVIGGAILLEYAQTLTPDRHGTLGDALEKIAGGIAGILLTKSAQNWRQRKTSTG